MKWSGRWGLEENADFERPQRAAGIAIADFGEELERVVVELYSLFAEATSFIGERATDDGFDVVDRQRFEFEHAAAADERAGQREEGILRGRADEDHGAIFNVGQEHILLGAVEAMDFVDEQERALTRTGD